MTRRRSDRDAPAPSPLRAGILADDLTGALDVAAAFARHGFTAAVALTPRRLVALDAQIVAVSTHSRHDSPAAARRKVRQACARLREAGRPLLYKKLDSTVQGNIVAEVESARRAGGFESALVCPANPAQGRTVLAGVLHVRGGHTVDLLERFREQGLLETNAASLLNLESSLALTQGQRFVLADAVNDDDLLRLARTALRSKHRLLPAGSAALAGALARLLGRRANPRRHSIPTRAKAPDSRSNQRGTLILAGSNNPVTERQLENLRRRTTTVAFALNHRPLNQAAAALKEGRHVILRVPVHQRPDSILLGQLRSLTPIFREKLVGSILLTGGDTAWLACRALRPEAIHIQGEIDPGLAWGCCVGGLADGLPVCTKPGGFGTGESLVRAVAFLSRQTGTRPRSAD